MAARVKITWRLDGLNRARLDISQGAGAWGTALKQIARIYAAAMKRRYLRFSQGGGDWEPLALSTVQDRIRRTTRQGKKLRGRTVARLPGGKAMPGPLGMMTPFGGRMGPGENYTSVPGTTAILRDTGLLVMALGVNAAGGLLDVAGRKVRVGFAETAHGKDGKLTYATIADFHQWGGGHLPQREIFVMPDAATIEQMRGALQGAWRTPGMHPTTKR